MAALNGKTIEQLLDQHSAPLVLYARQWTTDAEDCVQEAFIRLATCRREPDDPVCWLYRVTRNQAINSLRSQSRRKSRERAVAQSELVLQTIHSTELTPASVEESLQSLPAADREVVVARIWGKLSFQQIGNLIGASSSTAHRRYESALRRIKEHLTNSTSTRKPKEKRTCPSD